MNQLLHYGKKHTPSIIRWNAKKLPQEKYYVLILLFFGVVYFGFSFVLLKNSLWDAAFFSISRMTILLITYKLLRELSPDMQINYYFTMMMTASVLCFPWELYWWGTLFLLWTSRILTRSSGEESSNFELAILFLTSFLLFIFSSFIYPLNLCVALSLDFYFDKSRKKNLIPAILSAILSCTWFIRIYGITKTELSLFWIAIVLIAGVLFIFRISILKHILSKDDKDKRMLQPKRIKSANANLIITLLLFAIGYGKTSELAHLWIMVLCISLPYWKDIYKIHRNEYN